MSKFNMLMNLSTSKKMAFAISIFFIPIFALIAILWDNNTSVVKGSQKELEGLYYLRATHSVINALTVENATKENLRQAADILSKVEEKDAGGLGLTQASRDIVAMLQNGVADDNAISQVRSLVGKIADASGLLLDPDADTYFMVNLAVYSTPGMLQASNMLVVAAHGLEAGKVEGNQANYDVAQAEISRLAKEYDFNVQHAIAGNKDGTLKDSLALLGQASISAAEAAVKTAKTANYAALYKDMETLSSKLHAFGAKNRDELERLLIARIDRLRADLIKDLGIALLCMLIGSAISWLVVRSFVGPLVKITDIMYALSKGDFSTALENDGREDEIGKMSASLAMLRNTYADYAGQIAAIGKSQAVIAFNMDGTIIDANKNFLDQLGYTLEEVKGKHHSVFVDPAFKATADYQQFWENLNRGQYQAGEYKRIAKGGKEVWIQASYNPIADANGKAFKVVKYATDTTLQVQTRLENEDGMDESMRVLQAFSAGDLTERMTKDYKGAFAEIKTALNATVEKITEIVLSIKSSSKAVAGAATEISSGSADLSQRTENQASSLEETAASMEELTGTVRQNATRTEDATKESIKARELAQTGGDIVGRAVAAMGEIEKSSKKVSDIIGVIDEIAFQTNLLALNAAVEAARAGDAGKGFAVVASEVRSLAGRSASSSKEIKLLIEESSRQVKVGSDLVHEAGTSLQEIVAANNGVNGIISDISNATKEQTHGIEEINTAVTQMDEMTQQNAALVEENTAASQSLVEQARQLDKLIGFFKVSSADAGEDGASQEAAPKTTHTAPAKASHPTASKVAAKSPVAKKLTSAAHEGETRQYDNDWKEF